MFTAYTYTRPRQVYAVYLRTSRRDMSPDRTAALAAGLLYFSTHITSVAAVAAYGGTAHDPAALASPEAESRLLLGVSLEVLLALGVLGTGVVLLPLLARSSPILSNAFSAMRTLEAAVIAVGALPMLALVTAAIDPRGSLALHDAAFLIGQGLIISVNTLVIATLLVRTGVVPRWIGCLGLVGGAAVLTGNALQLVGAIERGGAIAGILAVPVFAFEISFATYLVARGLRAPQAATRRQPASTR